MRRAGILIAAALAAGAASADIRYLEDDELAAWSGVGFVTIKGVGGCTGALIRPDVVLTAAHCVADAEKKIAYSPSQIFFSAGVADGERVGAAWAEGIEIHPGYFASGRVRNEAQIRADFARIKLKRPIKGAETYPIDAAPPLGAVLSLVSYSDKRLKRASIQDGCRVLRRKTEFLTLDCVSAPGASGAPYLRRGADGRARIVGIHSGRSSRQPGGRAQALGLDHVREFLGAGGGFNRPVPLNRKAPAIGETPKRKGGTLLPGGSKPGDRLWRRDG